MLHTIIDTSQEQVRKKQEKKLMAKGEWGSEIVRLLSALSLGLRSNRLCGPALGAYLRTRPMSVMSVTIGPGSRLVLKPAHSLRFILCLIPTLERVHSQRDLSLQHVLRAAIVPRRLSEGNRGCSPRPRILVRPIDDLLDTAAWRA